MNLVAFNPGELWDRIKYLGSRFGSDRCSEHAAALTYMTLFALVPMMTLLYTMASAIPASEGLEHKLQGWLFEHLVPETSSEIKDYLTSFSQQARNLTGPGIAFLFITAVLMLRKIEKAFNTIWRARENRGAVSSFLLYWAVLSLAPLTIGVGLGLGTYLTQFSRYIDEFHLFGAGSLLINITPFLLSAAGFSLVYIAVPNARVPFRHTIIGGVITAAAFNSARYLFTNLMGSGSNYNLIYGAFAAVPLFLLWIYISWNIVLMGGILVHSLSAYQNREEAARPTVLKALDLLQLFWQKQKSGEALREIELLNDSHRVIRGLDSVTWGNLRDLFIEKKLITQNERGHYLLSRDLHTVSFWQIKEWVNRELPLDKEDISANLDWQERAYTLLREQRDDQREQLSISLVELFEQ